MELNTMRLSTLGVDQNSENFNCFNGQTDMCQEDCSTEVPNSKEPMDLGIKLYDSTDQMSGQFGIDALFKQVMCSKEILYDDTMDEKLSFSSKCGLRYMDQNLPLELPSDFSMEQPRLKGLKFCTNPTPMEVVYQQKNILAFDADIPSCIFQCPDFFCGMMLSESDVAAHFMNDHQTMSIDVVAPLQTRSLLMDPRLTERGYFRCHVMFLLRNKICGLGGGETKDLFPIVLMSGRIPRTKIATNDLLMIWLTGPVSQTLKAGAIIKILHRRRDSLAIYQSRKVAVNPIQEPQTQSSVFGSGNFLLLSPSDVYILTHGGLTCMEITIDIF